jgi:ssDNA-binding Zn-finger/Zn-ribbon topoisomerase 1
MSWTLVFVVFVAAIAVLILLKYKSAGQSGDSLSYRKLGKLVSPAERSFFGVLTLIVGDDLQTFAKVRVADVLAPDKGLDKSNWQRAFNKISAKHFDFVLCNKDDLAVVCAIELDDKSHNTKKGKARDLVVNQACESAGLILVRIKVKSAYTVSEVQESLKEFLPKNEAISDTGRVKSDACPKCSSKLVKRVAKKGKNAGKEFMACSTYPKCKYIQKKAL